MEASINLEGSAVIRSLSLFSESISVPNTFADSAGNEHPITWINFKSIRIPNAKSVTFQEKCYLTSINRFFDDSSLRIEHIKFPKSLTSIRSKSFMKLKNLTTVEFNDECGIKIFPYLCFYGCKSLKSIKIPNSVETIGKSCFSKCSSLEEVDFGSQSSLRCIEKESFRSCESLKFIRFPDSLRTIEDNAFNYVETTFSISENSELEEIGHQDLLYAEEEFTFPKGMKIIKDSISFMKTKRIHFPSNSEAKEICPSALFSHCIEEINIPRSVEKIGKYSIRSREINFDEGSRLSEIMNGAFCGSVLKKLSLPPSVKRIHPEIFSGLECEEFCFNGNKLFVTDNQGVVYSRSIKHILYVPKNVRRLIIPEHVERLSLSILSQTKIEHLHIPPKMKVIEDAGPALNIKRISFSPHSQLEYMDFSQIFSQVEFLVFPASLKRIDNNYFHHNVLRSVKFPKDSKLESIGCGAFENSENLTEIYLPASLEHISKSAFQNSKRLEKVTFSPDSKLKKIQKYCFYECNSLKYLNLIECKQLEHIGALFIEGTLIDSLILPQSLKKTHGRSIYNHRVNMRIESPNFIQLDDGVVYQGNRLISAQYFSVPTRKLRIREGIEILSKAITINECLNVVIFPASLVSIYDWNFEDEWCRLKIKFSKDSRIKTIGSRCFNGFTEITIPPTLETIGSQSFDNVKKLKFSQGTKLQSIGRYCFFGSNIYAEQSVIDKIKKTPGVSLHLSEIHVIT